MTVKDLAGLVWFVRHRLLIFTMEETFNKQNDRVCAWSSKETRELVPRIGQGNYPVLWGLPCDGVTSLHLCEKGVKTAARNFQRDILTNVVELLNQTMFQNRPWIFQQDSAAVHKVKTTQQ